MALLLSFLLFQPLLAADDTLAKIAPDVVVIRPDASRTITIVFSLKPGATLPQTATLTDALSKDGAVRASDMTFTWVTSSPPILTGRLQLNENSMLPGAAEYKGKLVFTWNDGKTPAQAFDYTLNSAAVAAFDVWPDKLAATVGAGESKRGFVRVRNTADPAISQIRISSLDLTDVKGFHRTHFDQIELPEAIRTGQEKEIEFRYPAIHWAGTYAGSLDITANGTTRKSIPVTIQTRGPYLTPGIPWPIAFFVVVLFLGFAVSNWAEDWFANGGLERAEALISLQHSRTSLQDAVKTVKAFETQHDVELSNFKLYIEDLLGDLDNALTSQDLTAAELTQHSKEFKKAAAVFAEFHRAVDIAVQQWQDSPSKLKKVLVSLDVASINVTDDLSAYRANLRRLARTDPDVAADLQIEAHRKISVTEGKPFINAAELEAQIKANAWLHRALVWLVVFAIAYQTFYASNPVFGTLSDYLSVFMWSLGLTATGTSILAKAKSSFTPPTR